MTSQIMRTDWRSISVRPKASTLQTMSVLSDGRLGIALVVDETDGLLGVVTDGDIRRAILKEVGLDAPISSLMESRFTAVAPETEPREVLKLMQTRSIRQVPVCNTEGRVMGLYVLEDLIEPPASRPNWVVIMAGGRGRRLRPLTDYIPKPMLPIDGRPLLEGVLDRVTSCGFRRVFISINYRGEDIVRHFSDGRRFGCSIEYIKEEQPLGTGGALSLLPETPSEPLLVTNADVLTDVDLAEVMDYHNSHSAAATLCVHEIRYRWPYGVVSCKGDEVVGLDEKPAHTETVNAGVYVLDPSLLGLVPQARGNYPITSLIQETQKRGLGVKAYMIKGKWMDVGRLEEYEYARQAELQDTGQD